MIIVPCGNTRFTSAQGGRRPWLLVGLVLLGGCIGDRGAVSVRWRIQVRNTGALLDPRDVSDNAGVCCTNGGSAPCAGQLGWHVTRVRVVVADPTTGEEIPDPPAGLDAPCSARELTTPFSIDEGQFAITLRAFDPAEPEVIEAESPSPEIRTVHKAEIVNLDVVALSVADLP